MTHRYRVVNLTGNPVTRKGVTVRDGVNFFHRLEEGALRAIQKTERLFVEEFCPEKQKYVPFGTALAGKETNESTIDNELETEKTDEVSNPSDDIQTPPSETIPSPESTPESAQSTSVSPIPAVPLSPEAEKILALSNDKASDLIIDIEDKALLEAIIQAPEVRAGTRSAAMRRLNFLNVDQKS